MSKLNDGRGEDALLEVLRARSILLRIPEGATTASAEDRLLI
jgi:hypothetical protein